MPIEEEAAGGEVPDLMPVLRSAAIQDREVLEKGIRAFVSYIRGYKEHQCKFIFRLQDLDLAELAYSCALLQLPRMPEVRKLGGKLAAFEPADINPNDVKVSVVLPETELLGAVGCSYLTLIKRLLLVKYGERHI